MENEDMSKIIWIDTETTGLDPKVHDVIQLAALVEIDFEVVEEIELKMRPIHDQKYWSPKALEIHGLEVDTVLSFPPAKDQIAEFISRISRHVSPTDRADKFVMAGFNLGFDDKMLRAMWEKLSLKYYGSFFTWLRLDVASIVAEQLGNGRIPTTLKNQKLATLCEHFGVELKAHDALEDIRATRELYKKVVSLRFELDMAEHLAANGLKVEPMLKGGKS